MPVYKQGYRRWENRELAGRFGRWLAITRAGVALTGRSRWLRRFLYVAWLPLLYYSFAFFVVGRLTEASTVEKVEQTWQFAVFQGMFGNALTDEFLSDPASFRPLVWSLLLHTFLRYTQVVSVMIVVAITGPRLVSEDLRSRALALYFSKPIGRVDYLVGKLGVVGFWVGMVSFVPCVALYAVSIAFSPSIDTLLQTWHIVPRIALFSLILIVGTGAPMLALSALSPNPRLLGFAWAGLWVLSSVASFILHLALRPPWDPVPQDASTDWSGLLSLWTNFNAVSYRVFDIGSRMGPVAEISSEARDWQQSLEAGHHWGWSLLLIAVASALSLLIVSLRVGRPGEAGAR